MCMLVKTQTRWQECACSCRTITTQFKRLTICSRRKITNDFSISWGSCAKKILSFYHIRVFVNFDLFGYWVVKLTVGHMYVHVCVKCENPHSWEDRRIESNRIGSLHFCIIYFELVDDCLWIRKIWNVDTTVFVLVLSIIIG